MKTKFCTNCNQEKTIDLFNKHRGFKDGLQYWCRECSKAKRRELHKAGYLTYEKRREGMLRYNAKHPDRIYARRAVRIALEKGKLVKQPCEKCGSVDVHAHHHKGYKKESRLEVKWLCQQHHYLEHLSEKK